MIISQKPKQSEVENFLESRDISILPSIKNHLRVDPPVAGSNYNVPLMNSLLLYMTTCLSNIYKSQQQPHMNHANPALEVQKQLKVNSNKEKNPFNVRVHDERSWSLMQHRITHYTVSLTLLSTFLEL